MTRPAINLVILSCCLLLGQAAWAVEERAAEPKDKSEPAPATKAPPAKAPAFTSQSGVVYVERGEKKLTADIYVPSGEGPFPAVLMVHGGAWMAGSSTNVYFHARDLASHGYTVVAMNYRLAPTHKFPAQIEDCKSAVRFMRRNAAKYKIDPNRIGAWGYSAGGHLVTLLGTTVKDDGLEGPDATDEGPNTRVQAVVAGGAPVNFLDVSPKAEMFNYWLGGTRKDMPEQYRLASPLAFVTPDDPPILFFHGSDDTLVPQAGVDRIRKKFTEAGVANELYEVQGAGHIQAFLSDKALVASREFFDKVLKAKAK